MVHQQSQLVCTCGHVFTSHVFYTGEYDPDYELVGECTWSACGCPEFSLDEVDKDFTKELNEWLGQE